MIVVTGASGTVGRHVVASLARSGSPCRALVHSDAGAQRLAGLEVELVTADLAAPATLSPALADADGLVLISPFGPDQEQWELNALDAAAAAGVTCIAKLSVLGGLPDTSVAMTRGHRLVESALESGPTPWRSLRCEWFTSNIDAQIPIIKGGILTYPHADAWTSPVDPRDVADLLVAVVLGRESVWGSGASGGVIEVTGPDGLTLRDHADVVSKATGKVVTFLDASPEDWCGGAVAGGVDPFQAAAVAELLGSYAQRSAPVLTPAIPELLGRPARTFEQYLQEISPLAPG